MIVSPDPKPAARVRDPMLLRGLHLLWHECALEEIGRCAGQHPARSLHHIDNKPRHDLQPNLVMLCGHGTAGCHGLIEARDPIVSAALYALLTTRRPDTMAWLTQRHGSPESAAEWLSRRILGRSVRAVG